MKSALKSSSTSFKEVLSKYELDNLFGVVFFVIGVASVVVIIYMTLYSAFSLDKQLEVDLKTLDVEEKVVESINNLSGFKTNVSNTSIPLGKLYKEGPARGFIPAITNPKFNKITDSDVTDSTIGIFVNIDDSHQRFYPLSILNWHEVVNDNIGAYPILVTYSPLTGTAAVFERKVGDLGTLVFDVTGMLYESNLIMFDTKTESLWSQNERRAIIGDYNGAQLSLIRSNIVSAEYAKKNYPGTMVLSEDTGFARDYEYDPYQEYIVSDIIYPEFGISKVDAKYPPKKMIYSVPFDNRIFSVFLDDLKRISSVKFEDDNFTLTIKKLGEEITAESRSKDPNVPLEYRIAELPGYYEMWYSWAVKHSLDGILYGN